MILIDTHVWIWLNSEPEKLSVTALARLQTEPRIAISAISVYETLLAIEKGRIASSVDPEVLVRRWLDPSDIVRIAVTEEAVIRARTLPFVHADPFDRIIAATAAVEAAELMTADRNLLSLNWLATVAAQ